MSIFSRRRSAPAPMPAPPPPAPVAQPEMPNPYLRNLPPPTQVALPVGLDQQRVQQPQPMDLQQRLMQQAQPNLSGAMGQLRAGDNVAAQNTMRQIVGLPPLPASPQMANPSLADAIALGKAGDQAGMQRMMQQIVGLPPAGAPQQGPTGMPQLSQQQAAAQRAALGIPPDPGLTAYKLGMGPQQPGILGGAYPGQLVAQQPGMQQPYMPQRMTMDMPQTNQPMIELPTQPGLTPMPFPQPGMQPQQPNSLWQQFGQAQNPFARPMQPGIGSQMSQPAFAGPTGTQPQQPGLMQQQPFGQAGAQPQQPGMQQNSPMQKAGGSTGRTGLF